MTAFAANPPAVAEPLDLETCFGTGPLGGMTVTSSAAFGAEGIRDGDVLVIRRGEKFKDGDRVACVIEPDWGNPPETVMRIAYHAKGGAVRLCSPLGESIHPADQVRVIGTVVGLVRVM